MARIEEVRQYMEQIAPESTAAAWDNVGVLVDCGTEVTSILVALDITEDVVVEAEMQGCQLIVSHHPVIFRPLGRISRKDLPFRMIKKNVSALCAHTNLDAAEGGVNDILCRLFGVNDPTPFGEGNLGRVGEIEAISAKELAQQCKKTLNAGSVRLVDAGRPIHRLAVVGGSGASLMKEAVEAGADALLTGDVDHHDGIDARSMGLSLIAAGHYATEFPIVPVLASQLAQRFPELRVLRSRKNKEPFIYL